MTKNPASIPDDIVFVFDDGKKFHVVTTEDYQSDPLRWNVMNHHSTCRASVLLQRLLDGESKNAIIKTLKGQ
jgi:hypothetical protein